MSKLSIIIPVLNEGEGIATALDALADLRALGTEVIVVDGGSRDATIQRARPRADRVILATYCSSFMPIRICLPIPTALCSAASNGPAAPGAAST